MVEGNMVDEKRKDDEGKEKSAKPKWIRVPNPAFYGPKPDGVLISRTIIVNREEYQKEQEEKRK